MMIRAIHGSYVAPVRRPARLTEVFRVGQLLPDGGGWFKSEERIMRMNFRITHGHYDAITVRRPIRICAFPSFRKDRTQCSSIGGEQVNLPGLIIADAGKQNLFTLRRPARGQPSERRARQSQALGSVRVTPPQGAVGPVRVNDHLSV